MRYKILSTIGILAGSVFLFNMIVGWTPKNTLIPNSSISQAVAKSLLLMEKGSYLFTVKSRDKCASCHNTTLSSMAAAIALRKGIPVVDSFSVQRVGDMERTLKRGWNDNHVNDFVTAKFVGSYMLFGLYAEKYAPSAVTDIAVDFMMNQARPDGSFQCEASRVPLETGEIHLAAMSIKAIQLYASASKKQRVDALTDKTRQWLEQAAPDMQQEIAFQLLGLQWTNGNKEIKTKVAEKLISMQNKDGGWSQLPSMQSDSYATGQALYALYESGVMEAADAIYQKGIAYLLKTQEESGAWIVETRAYPIQPFFNGDFPPYDENQFISAAGTGWSTLALLDALPDKIN